MCAIRFRVSSSLLHLLVLNAEITLSLDLVLMLLPMSTRFLALTCAVGRIYMPLVQECGETLKSLLPFDSSPFNAFLHGALHWTRKYWTRSGDFMYLFNFETEKFGTVPPPSHFAPKDLCSLGVSEGCLLLCGYGGNTSKFEMWIMRDYGVQESWTKTFVIESLNPRKAYDPNMFLSNGEILMSYGDGVGAVVCYNPETKSIRETSIAPIESQFVVTGYSPSFVSLHDIAKGQMVKRIRNNENFNKLFTEGSITAAGSGTSAHQCTNLNPVSSPPGVEKAPCSHSVTTSSATSNEQLDFAMRIGTKCAICAGELGYVFRGKGFAMCQKCFDASSS
uniref:uncharacterized protein LOC105351075 n=1 Tax=Fragaria vesca subsp. vesca TaxID=101020 RepID=UPI0005CB0B2B|nr:PREDICTED: uncharacterized protein LOC105351075 [Fragaria vesca subsp. vesca]